MKKLRLTKTLDSFKVMQLERGRGRRVCIIISYCVLAVLFLVSERSANLSLFLTYFSTSNGAGQWSTNGPRADSSSC